MRFFSSFCGRGYFSSLCAICCLVPYLVWSHLCGKSCSRCSGLCWYLCNFAATYSDMKLFTVNFWLSQFIFMPQYKLPFHSLSVNNSLIASIKWSAYYLPTSFTPKSSTTKGNNIGSHLCLHSPGVCLHWKYTLGSIYSVFKFFGSVPACDNTYIPLKISK